MSQAASDVVRVEHDGGLAVLTIDSPPLNLFGPKLHEALRKAVAELASDPPRALLIRAEGKVVSGGADVHTFEDQSTAGGRDRFTGLIEFVQAVEDLPFPTVFGAHALCLTAALELALACDLILAAESARFGLVEARVGLTPGMGGTQRLAERAGPGRAREFVMTAGLYDAATLERWGVVNRVLPDEGFDAAARAFAAALAAGPTRAHAATKRIVRAYLDGGVRGADAVVPEHAGPLFETEDLRNAVRTFFEEGPGKAKFEGR